MTIASKPQIAVIMTCYNEGPYIGPAVRSVLDQSRADLIETIIIADDGSDAETLATLREIERWDDRIRTIFGPGGVGLPGQRHLAISQTQAPFIAILDGDDLWHPRKLELQHAALLEKPEAGLVYSDFYTFPDFDLQAARRAGVLDISDAPDLLVRYFLNDPPIVPSTTLIRRSAYGACGGFDASVRIFEDTDFYLRMARVTRFCLTNEPLLYKRYRTSSITGGRKDLLAHHAFVALRAAAEEPRLLPFVPRRLAERARKLGNQRFLLDDRVAAVALLQFAVRLHPWNWRSWTSLIAAKLFPRLALKLLGDKGKARRRALGVT